jgi:type II secretory pathway component PulM
MATRSVRLAPPPRLARWWAEKTPGERRVATAMALLVAATLGWLVAWQPLQRDLAALRADVPAERAALAEAEHMAAEIAGLARAAPSPPAPEAQAALERILGEHGLRGNATQIEWHEGRARIAVDAVPFDALVAALDALDREARLSVVEATLTARVEPGTVRAELVVAR